MIIFLSGKDTFRLKTKQKELLFSYQEKNTGYNLIFFDCLKTNFQSLLENISQNSLFREKKLVLIENLFKNKELKEKFLKEIKSFLISENLFLISEDQDLSEKDSLVSFLMKNASCQKFPLLKNFEIKKWIKKQVLEIEPEALDLLADSNDLWKVNNEVQKLISFNKKITKKSVLLLTERKTESDIFKTIEAIANKNKKKALSLLYNHIKKGDNCLYLLSMISYQFKNLIILKELSDKKLPLQKSKLSFFVIQKSTPLLEKFSLKELKKIYHKLFEIDTFIKIGKIEPEAGLELLIAEI